MRYEKDGSVTVLAEKFEGKSFNAPNAIVVHAIGGICLTHHEYGISGHYEGNKAPISMKEASYRIDSLDGKTTKVTDNLFRPNGLCFSQTIPGSISRTQERRTILGRLETAWFSTFWTGGSLPTVGNSPRWR